MSQKRVFVFIIASLMLFSLVSSFVSAQRPGDSNFIGPLSLSEGSWGIFEPIRTFWTEWKSGNGYSFGFAKFFVLIIIWILVTGILDKFPGLKGDDSGKKYMRFFLGFAIAFLASAYFTATELALIVTSYSAMGFVLGAMVPFLIMVFFTTSTVETIKSSGGSIRVQNWTLRGLWIVFGGYFLYRVLYMGGASATDFVVYGHWIVVGLSLLIVAFLPLYIKKAMKSQEEVLMALAKGDVDLRAELRAEKAENMRKLQEKLQKSKGISSREGLKI